MAIAAMSPGIKLRSASFFCDETRRTFERCLSGVPPSRLPGKPIDASATGTFILPNRWQVRLTLAGRF
jgi:hypothetical protein